MPLAAIGGATIGAQDFFSNPALHGIREKDDSAYCMEFLGDLCASNESRYNGTNG